MNNKNIKDNFEAIVQLFDICSELVKRMETLEKLPEPISKLWDIVNNIHHRISFLETMIQQIANKESTTKFPNVSTINTTLN